MVDVTTERKLASDCSISCVTVAVVIPTFNHARFLADAISSVIAQTHPANEIIVVDDGSTDDPASIVANFPTVRLIRQENRGLSGARNAGLRNCQSSHLIFLDADDRLLPVAIEAGLNHAAKCPHCAFVYGGFYVISENGTRREPDYYPSPLGPDAHREFLCAQGSLITLPATVLYRRECLIEEGGFDEQLHSCGDYDLYLRIARKYDIANYPVIVGEYRRHSKNMTNNYLMVLRESLFVLHRHEKRSCHDAWEKAALRKGRAHFRRYYTSCMLELLDGSVLNLLESVRLLSQASKSSPTTVVRWVLSGCKRALRERWLG
jgi:glycosyltransferase involved in cell wall biosynthesis